MTDEDQKAWDMFAAAALSGYFANEYTPHLGAATKETAQYLCSMADAMMYERKERIDKAEEAKKHETPF